jgi:hypothetical protein
LARQRDITAKASASRASPIMAELTGDRSVKVILPTPHSFSISALAGQPVCAIAHRSFPSGMAGVKPVIDAVAGAERRNDEGVKVGLGLINVLDDGLQRVTKCCRQPIHHRVAPLRIE